MVHAFLKRSTVKGYPREELLVRCGLLLHKLSFFLPCQNMVVVLPHEVAHFSEDRDVHMTRLVRIALLVTVLGVLVSCASSTHHSMDVLSMTGTVEGHLDTCSAQGFPGLPPYSTGTVNVYKASVYAKVFKSGVEHALQSQDSLAKATTSPNHPFRFVLPEGSYTLVGTYAMPGSNARSVITVQVKQGAVQHANLPDMCK